jgi:hypothetical protein
MHHHHFAASQVRCRGQAKDPDQMFTDKDIDFHTPPGAPWDWCETNYFAFSIPEERIWGTIYAFTRPALGVMLVEVAVGGALSADRANILYLDSQCHLPMVEKLSDFETVNGLRIKARDLKHYDIGYSGYEGMELNFSFDAIMDPFDLNDPEMNPLVGRRDAGGVEREVTGGPGVAWANHFEMAGKIKGNLRLNGKKYDIDYFETMDHSWGRRHIWYDSIKPMYWFQAHFGEDLAFHWNSHWDVLKPNGQDQKLASGYVVENGKTYGLLDVQMRVTRVDQRTATSMDVDITDVRGKKFKMYGICVAGVATIQAYNAMDMRNYLVKWIMEDGRVGHSVAIEGAQMACLAPRTATRWTGETDAQATETRITW